MKKTFKLVALTAVACIIAFSATLFSCKKVTDGIRVRVNTNIFTSPIGVHFVNLNTTSTNRPGDFSISISGRDAAKVYTSDGGNSYKVFGGFISLALDKAAAPSPAKPVNFTITANLSGFAPIVYQVSITSDSSASIVIPVVEYASLPVNTASLTQAVTLTGGAAPATILTPAPTATLTNPATINIVAGTIFKDAAGNQINGSNLNVTALQYAKGSINALPCLPGGLSPTDVLDINGNPIPGGVSFVSAGAIAMQMNVDNTPVKSFDTALQVSMPLDANLVNITKNATVAAGDVIPVWSMDETTGQFKNEGNATVVSSGGKLVATFPVTHLSVWSLAWTGTACTTPLHLTINTSVPSFTGGNYVIAYVTTQGNNTNIIGQPLVTPIYNGMSFDLINVPSGVQGHIVVADLLTQTVVATGTDFTSCVTPSTSVTVPIDMSNYIIVQTAFVGYCTDKEVTANLTGTVSYANKTNELDFGTLPVLNGFARVSIPNGSEYVMTAIDNGKSFTADVTFQKNDFKFPPNSGITNGTAVYDAPSNTLSLAGQLNFSCK